ncbi:MAG: OmpA family protein [Alphaproteobacteria bacterium]|nr:OmpA family protein [Alphaproteobacteria bacterium]
MSFSRRRRNSEQFDIWPGFVDALSTVLLVFIFVLVGFIASQIYLSGVIFDKDSSLSSLRSKLADVCSLLNLEKDKNAELKDVNADLSKQIKDLNSTVETLQGLFDRDEARLKSEAETKKTLEEKIETISAQLKDVLAALAAEKQTAEERLKALEIIKKENIKLTDLSKMNAYRSEFFDKLQAIVKDKKGIRIAGDRFIFQSELFFESASDELSQEGKKQVSELAKIVKEIADKIPDKIKWILRVDGHTDQRPITSPKFASNWELSAARAISVVKHLVKEGIPAKNLVAAGFGENQPISDGKSTEDLAKNRRIEFKLDER